MQKSRGSGSRSNPDRQPFTTIDDALETAKKLTAMLVKLGGYKHPLDVRKGRVSKHRKEVESVAENDESRQLKGSGRTYFFDIKKTKDGKRYLVITESRKSGEDKFERSSIMVFPEDAGEFNEAVAEMTAKIE